MTNHFLIQMYLKSCVLLQVFQWSDSCPNSAAKTANIKSWFVRLKVPQSRLSPGASTAPRYALSHSGSISPHQNYMSPFHHNCYNLWRSYPSALFNCKYIYLSWLWGDFIFSPEPAHRIYSHTSVVGAAATHKHAVGRLFYTCSIFFPLQRLSTSISQRSFVYSCS